MAVSKSTFGFLTAPFQVSTEAAIDITSTDLNNQDEIIPSQRLGALPESKVSVQCIESNNKEVYIQPWVSMDNTNWVKVKYSNNRNHWVIPANSTDLVFFKDTLMFLYFKLTGYLPSAGTGKIMAHALFK